MLIFIFMSCFICSSIVTYLIIKLPNFIWIINGNKPVDDSTSYFIRQLTEIEELFFNKKHTLQKQSLAK